MKIRNLLARVNELLDPLLSIDARNHEHDAWAVRRDALHELNLRGLSGNPVYSDIEEKVKFPSVTRDKDSPEMRKLVGGYCSPGLRFLRCQLELAAKLLSQRRRPRPKHRPKAGFRLSPKEADSRGRARTAVLPLEQLMDRRSLRQKEAACQLGGISPRMVRTLVKDKKLTKTGIGRILCDEKFALEYKKRHTPPPK